MWVTLQEKSQEMPVATGRVTAAAHTWMMAVSCSLRATRPARFPMYNFRSSSSIFRCKQNQHYTNTKPEQAVAFGFGLLTTLRC